LLGDVEIWFQDEMRVGQQGSITRMWAIKGTRPLAVRQQQFLNAYVYGAVCPEKDKGAGLILPRADSACMNAHLKEISLHVDEGKHAVIVVDGATWHKSKELVIPYNITLLPLPPYSPELNPQERVWQDMRKESLSNRAFESIEEIIDTSCEAWNEFISVPKRIKNMCSRKWANLSS
jgi:transposase